MKINKDLDKIAKLAYKAILKWHAQAIWEYEVALWIPDEFLPLKAEELNEVSAKIFQLIKKGETK